MSSTMMQLFGRDLVQFVIIGVATNLKGWREGGRGGGGGEGPGIYV
jgi:hypothetical protein